MLKLGELGEVSFGMLKLGDLGEVSFGMLKLGEVSFGKYKLGELGKWALEYTSWWVRWSELWNVKVGWGRLGDL